LFETCVTPGEPDVDSREDRDPVGRNGIKPVVMKVKKDPAEAAVFPKS